MKLRRSISGLAAPLDIENDVVNAETSISNCLQNNGHFLKETQRQKLTTFADVGKIACVKKERKKEKAQTTEIQDLFWTH